MLDSQREVLARHVFQRTITENLYDEARHVFKTDEHVICATRPIGTLN